MQTTSFSLHWFDSTDQCIPTVVFVYLKDQQAIIEHWTAKGEVTPVEFTFYRQDQAALFVEWLNSWLDPLSAFEYFDYGSPTHSLINDIAHRLKCSIKWSMADMYEIHRQLLYATA